MHHPRRFPWLPTTVAYVGPRSRRRLSIASPTLMHSPYQDKKHTALHQIMGLTRWRRLGAWLGVLCAVALIFPTVANASNLRSDDLDHDLRSTTRSLAVFGADDRHTVSDVSLYPYSAVGLLKWNPDRVCTASLVASKYAITAAECVFEPDGSRRSSTLPEPELVVGAGSSSPTTVKVVKLHRQSSFWKQWIQETYVILELDQDVGDSHGVLLLPTIGDLDESIGKTPVQMVGFDGDAVVTPTTALKFSTCTCYFPSTFNGEQYMFHHDCDTSTVGSPGSVLLVRYTSMETYIIGIHTNMIGDRANVPEIDQNLAAYSDDVANRGVLGPFIEKHLEAILEADSDSSSGSPSKKPTRSPPGTGSSSASQGGSPTVGSQGAGDVDEATSSSASGRSSIGSTVAYMCIAFVACAWVCIIFIAVHNMRSNKRRQQQQP